ncbi:MAG: DUF4238 domain-containing protein [Alphaproteobacteria bacterium]
MADNKKQRAEDQHYVPKSILRNFTRGHKEKVCVFDKQSGKEFETNLRNILAERRFNDVFVGDRYISLEPAVTELEGTLLSPLRRVVEARRSGPDTRGTRILAPSVGLPAPSGEAVPRSNSGDERATGTYGSGDRG